MRKRVYRQSYASERIFEHKKNFIIENFDVFSIYMDKKRNALRTTGSYKEAMRRPSK